MSLAVLAVVVLGILVAGSFTVDRHRSPHPARRSAAETVETASRPCVRPPGPPVRTHHMIVLGASYTAGVGASDPQHGYAWQLADRLDETARVYGVPGTGFVDPGPRHEGTFLERLRRIPTRPAPDLVLIQGGRDDRHASPRLETESARATICLAERRFAGARVVVLGPIPARFPLRHHVLGIDTSLRRVCRAEHVRYLDPLDEHWITSATARRYTGSVPDHPNDAGYRYIAERATADLRENTGRDDT